MCSRLLLICLTTVLIAAAPPTSTAASTAIGPRASAGGAKVFLTPEEALALVFEGCEVTRSTVALNPKQKKRIGELAGAGFSKGLVFPYVATRDGKLVGTAYFDVHKVRTLRETVMIVIDPQDRIQRIEILAFGEPQQYLPRAKWYAQFVGQKLDKQLSLKHGIKGVTGATLTARATTSAARRVLAVHRVLGEIHRERARGVEPRVEHAEPVR